MNKFTFISDFVPYSMDKVNTATKITHEFEASSLDEILAQFTDFLRGAGFHFDGNVEIVNDYPVEKDSTDWDDFNATAPSTKVMSAEGSDSNEDNKL